MVAAGANLDAAATAATAATAGARRLGRGPALHALAAIVWALTAWFVADRLIAESTGRQLEREQAEVSASAASIGAQNASALAHLRNIPKVLANDPDIVRVLSQMGPYVAQSIRPPLEFRQALEGRSELRALAGRLVRMVEDLGVDQIWVVNAAGDCIVSGGFSPDASATGINYADREYFTVARRDGISQQFAVGRTTLVPGIYHSAAVAVAGKFLGVVVVKVNATRLARQMSGKHTFITDDNGVVVVSDDADLLMKATPGDSLPAMTSRQRLARYGREDFEKLAIESVEVNGFRLLRLAGRPEPMLAATSGNTLDTLRVWVFRDASAVTRWRGDFYGLFILLLFGGESLLVAVVVRMHAAQRSREHQAEVTRINAELVKLNDELRVQACFDALTGCRSRRFLLEEVGNELKRATRFAQPCALAMLDIDHFKEVNDHYGHAAGDALLKHFVATISGRLRATDVLGRLGGEEFALLMPQTGRRGALEAAERIRAAVEAAVALLPNGELRVTVSIGVDQWRGADDHVDGLVARADAAMYEAKRNGRNRVCSAPVDAG